MKLQEQHIYGSARLGVVKPDLEMIGAVDPSDVGEFDRMRGMKRYELSNHLGNVLTVISDRKIATVDNGVNIYYHAEIISYTDYYPFGAPMSQGTTDRTWSVEEYRYGFNGQERELQITGFNTHTSAEFWMYDSRIGRRWNVDPVYKHEMSSYSCFSNSPSNRVDRKGDTDDKHNSSNPNNPSAKGGQDRFHKETVALRKGQQEKINAKEKTTAVNQLTVGTNPPTEDSQAVEEIKTNTDVDISEQFKSIAEEAWNSPIARYWIPDYYTYSFSFQTASFAYMSEEVSFTFLLRGKDPGIYLTTTTGAGVVNGVDVNVGFAKGPGYFLGDPRNFSSEDLGGNQFSASLDVGAEFGVGAQGSAGFDMGFDEQNNPSTVNLKGGVSFGLGIRTPGPGFTVGGGHTSPAIPLFKF